MTPGRYCPGARTISGGRRVGSALVSAAERLGTRCGRVRIVAQALDALDSGQPLAFTQPDEAYALRVAPNDRDFGHRRAHQSAGRTNHHELMLGIDLQCRHHLAVALGGLQRNDALAAATVLREVLERSELAVTVRGGGEHEPVADDDERDELLPGRELDTAYAGGFAAHRAHLLLVEA